MKRKIIRGKIKSIDSIISKADYTSCDGDVDLIKYYIKLENDENEYRTATSLGEVKEGDLIDIYCYDNDNNTIKDECVILNAKTSKRLLNHSRFDSFLNYWMMFVSSSGFYVMISDIEIFNKGIIDIMMFICLCIMSMFLFFSSIKLLSKNLTRKEKALLKEYKKGKINSSDISMSDIEKVKEKITA